MREKGWLALAVNKQLLEMLEYAHGLMQEHADLAGQRMSLSRLYAQVEQDAKEPNRNAKLLRLFSPWEQQDKERKDEEYLQELAADPDPCPQLGDRADGQWPSFFGMPDPFESARRTSSSQESPDGILRRLWSQRDASTRAVRSWAARRGREPAGAAGRPRLCPKGQDAAQPPR